MKIVPFLKINKSKSHELYVRMRDSYEGKDYQSTIGLGHVIDPKHFKGGRVSTRHPDYLIINEELNGIISELRRILVDVKNEGKYPLPSLVKHLYEEEIYKRKFDTVKIVPFWTAFEEWRETKNGLSRGYTKTLLTLGNRLKGFEKKRRTPITFNYITTSTQLFQSHFQNYLWDDRNLTNGYINKLFNSLSSFLHYSHEMGYISKKPRFKVQGTPKLLEKPFLRSDEVIKLFNSDQFDYKTRENWEKLQKNKKVRNHLYLIHQKLEGKNSQKWGGELVITNWELIRFIHLWCCSVGCRFGDVEHFKVNDFTFDRENKHMEWIQQKTKRRNSVPINDISGYIFTKFSRGKKLDQNLFPPISIQKFNKSIKYLLEELKFNRELTIPRQRGSILVGNKPQPLYSLISSHSGRHSFITNTIELGTMDYKTIMSLSGHTTTSSFLGYVSVLENQRIKARDLYKLEKQDPSDVNEELLNKFNKLDSQKKVMIINLIDQLQ
jgi:integrase